MSRIAASKRKPILSYFPYESPRPVQAELLTKLESIWDQYDVFVVTLPTAAGKTAISKTIMDWVGKGITITPTNLLVEQYISEFPQTCSLSRLDSYKCEEMQSNCAVVKGRQGRFCYGCPAASSLQQVKYRGKPAVVNYYTYVSQKLHRNTIIVDEAHSLVPTMQGFDTKTLWKHDAEYAHNMYTIQQVRYWLDKMPEKKKRLKKIELLNNIINVDPPTHVVERAVDWFNGKGTIRNEPELRDCLKYYPLEPSQATKNMFFPKEVEKIVLMSATISKVDIEEMGLGKRRVVFLNAASPIAKEARPIIPIPLMNVNRGNIEEAVEKMASYISDVLLPRHLYEKGLVHVTYQMAGMLRKYLEGNPRIIFHDKYNKREMYEHFRASDAHLGKVLIACGMYEGIDLPNDLGRWQVVAKIPWPSLGNPAIQYKSESNNEWYTWETLKTVIQACGRICRTPSDYGVTYILDASFSRLYKQTEHISPEWWKEALVTEEEFVNGLEST